MSREAEKLLSYTGLLGTKPDGAQTLGRRRRNQTSSAWHCDEMTHISRGVGGLATASTENEKVKAMDINLLSNCSFKHKNQARVHVSCRILMVSAFSKHFRISFHLLHPVRTPGQISSVMQKASFCGCFLLFEERSLRLFISLSPLRQSGKTKM